MTFINKAAGLVAAAALLIPVSASAAPVVWNFSGAFSNAPETNYPGGPSALQPGVSYNLAVTFDAAAFTQSFGSGTYRSPANATSFSFDLDCNDSTGFLPCASPAVPGFDSAILFDNFSLTGNAPYSDVLWLAFHPNQNDSDWAAIFRLRLNGPDSIFDSGAAVPEDLSPFRSHVIEMCDELVVQVGNPPDGASCNTSANTWRVVGRGGPATAVPEPATLALLSVGLAAIGLARRRKRVI